MKYSSPTSNYADVSRRKCLQKKPIRKTYETARRREKQQKYNAENGITPETIKKKISDILDSVFEKGDRVEVAINDEGEHLVGKKLEDHIKSLEAKMKDAAGNLEFEEAARLRDEIKRLQAEDLGL